MSFCLFWNFLTCNLPIDIQRFGYGCPWKWCYDPGYRHTGWQDDQHAVTTFEHWRFDLQAGLLDAGVAVGLIVVWLAANEVWQVSQGRRQPRR